LAQQPAFLTNGLVAYYPFSGSTKELSRNGKDAVLKGSNPRFYTNNPAGLFLDKESWGQISPGEMINPVNSRTITFRLRNFDPRVRGRVFSNRRESSSRNWDIEVNKNAIWVEEFSGFDNFVSFGIPLNNCVSEIAFAFSLNSTNGEYSFFVNGKKVNPLVKYTNISSLVGWVNASGLVPLDIGREEALKWPLPSPKYYLVM
jgi:hypothetical protein